VSGDDYTAEVFRKRAVSEEVARERGYRRYGADDAGRAVLREIDRRLLEPEHAAWLRSVLVVPGWAMPRHAVMPGHSLFGAAPYTQLRPDRPVKPRRSVHNHNGMKHCHRDDDELRGRGGRCYCGDFHTRPPVRRGKLTPRGWEDWYGWWQPRLTGRERKHHEASQCEWADPSSVPKCVRTLDERDDGKVLVPTGHLHPDTGRVVVRRKGQHAHLDWAKYVYVNGEGKAAGLGTHPWVQRDLEWGVVAPEGVFFFVIEGTLKLDAVVSAGWPGIESGSVTLWNAEDEDYEAEWEEGDLGEPYLVGGAFVQNELEEFARRYLEGVPTAIVCDSDADVNPRVRRHVQAAVRLLKQCGVPAVGCAPPPGKPLGWKHRVYGLPMHEKQGVDDWLATKPERRRHDALLDLRVWDTKSDPPGLEAAVNAAVGPQGEASYRDTRWASWPAMRCPAVMSSSNQTRSTSGWATTFRRSKVSVRGPSVTGTRRRSCRASASRSSWRTKRVRPDKACVPRDRCCASGPTSGDRRRSGRCETGLTTLVSAARSARPLANSDPPPYDC
jgi:hypothetical protein